MKDMSNYRETAKRDWVVTIALIIILMTGLSVGVILLLPDFWYLFIVVAAGSLVLLVRWHNRNFAFRCRNCGHEFGISAMRNFFSPHGIDESGGWKYLKCPHCQRRTRARVIKKI